MLKLPDNKLRVLFICGGLFCFLTAFVLLQSFKGKFGKEPDDVSGLAAMEDTIDVSAAKAVDGAEAKRVASAQSGRTAAKWVVYVTGSVKKPGVYELPEGSRVYQALEAAGGFAEGADQEGINLASMLADGEHVRFPSLKDTKGAPPGVKPSARQPAPSSGVIAPGLINLNTCNATELETLPGIGSKTAQTILTHRELNGEFTRTEDLLLIKGIGPKKYDAIRKLVTVGS